MQTPITRSIALHALLTLLLLLPACGTAEPVTNASPEKTVVDEVTISQRAKNSMIDAGSFGEIVELDDLCWYIRYEKNLVVVTAPVTINCKRKTGGVAQAAVFYEAQTGREAIHEALARIKQTPGATGEGHMDKANVNAGLALLTRLNEQCWHMILEKNSGWQFTGKVRKPNELVSRTVFAEGTTLYGVLKEAVRVLDAR